MPIETIPRKDVEYYLIAFDKSGAERTDDPDGRMSQVIREALVQHAVTDVFLFSHGWKGDIPAAREQYNKWIGVLADSTVDINRMRQLRNGFQPMYVGLHWPSLPFGEEGFGPGASFDALTEDPIPGWIAAYADRLADTPRARDALRVIFAAAMEDSAPPSLPAEVVEAYCTLNEEAALGAEGEGAAPGSDREAFDPEAAYASEDQAVAFAFSANKLLGPLRQLSFWKMKDRARQIGSTGMHDFVAMLQNSVPAGRDVRFHCMGHSFGCIVMSSLITGRDAKSRLPKPIQSLVLVQGALSLWSYCSDIPHMQGKPGYFTALLEGGRVAGPICITTSEHDLAVGWLYPAAAGVARQVEFVPGEFPKYGALGAFGAQGPGLEVIENDLQDITHQYQFQAGQSYNFNGSGFINEGSGLSGAHSDIAKAQVAHLIWSAAAGS